MGGGIGMLGGILGGIPLCILWGGGADTGAELTGILRGKRGGGPSTGLSILDPVRVVGGCGGFDNSALEVCIIIGLVGVDTTGGADSVGREKGTAGPIFSASSDGLKKRVYFYKTPRCLFLFI